MSQSLAYHHRRAFIAGLGAAAVSAAVSAGLAAPARAAGLGSGLTGMLVQASDTSLDKLSQPGAWYGDPAIRILLPLVGGGGMGRKLGKLLKAGDRLGLTNDLTRSLNDAAGLAAREAKPVFRAAIEQLSLADMPGIVSQNDGATRYLKRTAGGELQTRLRPLIDSALGQVGAFQQLDRLGQGSGLLALAGLTHDGLGRSVTEQALGGIFTYIGGEETRLRANPLGPAGAILKGIL